MKIVMSTTPDAISAYELVRGLQKRFVKGLDNVSATLGDKRAFEEVNWLRDDGVHGGGSRFEARDKTLFNTASVNVSQVHYDELPEKNLQSASAISTIIHPKNPHVPSIHIHISLTQLRDGSSYWRLMADLNPSIEYSQDTQEFEKALKSLSNSTYEEGVLQGEKYFNIPALKRRRGVSHFYLENYKTDNKTDDYNFAKTFGEGVIDAYIDIITEAFTNRTAISQDDIQKQLDYHTLYLFQVLTLDRGTTSGLMIHNQNDVGIMGSLPTFINRDLLASWAKNVSEPQNKLVESLLDAIKEDGKIDVPTKTKLAQAVRVHYKNHPQALTMQASGNTIPSTVNNHTDAK